MIVIKNTQRRIKLDLVHIKKDVQKILDILDYPDFDLGILFCSNEMIRKYNRDYRDKDKPTDILSFPYHPDLKVGQRIKPKTDEDKNLGDLILAPRYIQDDLSRWDQTFEERLRILLVHGICHLLGYDHIEDKDYKVMKKLEDKILAQLSLIP